MALGDKAAIGVIAAVDQFVCLTGGNESKCIVSYKLIKRKW